jgi:hypothetical protein
VLKKTLLGLALTLTAANLAAGAAYAAICQSTGGSRTCGLACATNPDGSCSCTGACSADELKWVEGAGGKAAALEEASSY